MKWERTVMLLLWHFIKSHHIRFSYTGVIMRQEMAKMSREFLLSAHPKLRPLGKQNEPFFQGYSKEKLYRYGRTPTCAVDFRFGFTWCKPVPLLSWMLHNSCNFCIRFVHPLFCPVSGELKENSLAVCIENYFRGQLLSSVLFPNRW